MEIEEEAGLGQQDIELLKRGEPLEVVDEEMGRKWIVHPYRFCLIGPEKIRIDWEHSELKWIDPEDIEKYETASNLSETGKWWYNKESRRFICVKCVKIEADNMSSLTEGYSVRAKERP